MPDRTRQQAVTAACRARRSWAVPLRAPGACGTAATGRCRSARRATAFPCRAASGAFLRVPERVAAGPVALWRGGGRPRPQRPPGHAAFSGPAGRTDEKNLVTKEFSELDRAFSGGEILPELLRAQVRTQPDAVAVVHPKGTLKYRELGIRSTELAAFLRRAGVAGDDCVGLFVEPSMELMVGAWGILFAGSAYLPLSPEYPEERLRYMIEDAGVTVVFTQEHLRHRLTELAPQGTRIVTPADVAEWAAVRDGEGREDPVTDPRPDDLAYVIYTSGSTGKPKGVMIEHRSIVSQMRWLRETYGIGPDKTVLQKTPMSFDAAQWEILAPACGSKVVMGAPGIYRDPEQLIETIAEHGVTTLQCVPTLLQALLDTEELHTCTSLGQIFSGGEALTRNLAVECLEAMPHVQLVNVYGPTECTINSSAFTVDRDTVKEGPHAISIGAPVHGTEYVILDEKLSPVAAGEIGELYIGGAQLARGYLHRPDLTADRFVERPPAAGGQGGRLYRTGDLAHWNADGTVQFAGRTDNQVKLRGFRVELDEIRLAIETHDWVKNAAVIVKKDPRTGFQNLISFIELNPKEAALMDQGNHGAHHQSKKSKLQVKAQLANMGCREPGEVDGKEAFDLPGREATAEQRARVFARKTYRFYEGGEVEQADILRLLGRKTGGTGPRELATLGFAEFGEILRWFGQYLSEERLLAKYGYASPGSLYATQMYLELSGIAGLRPGFYYYHPVHHRLVLIDEAPAAGEPRVKVHFMGKKRAIEPVYKNNIQEVLEIETGHMVALFEEILPAHGLNIQDLEYAPAVREHLECADEDYYLGTYEISPRAVPRPYDLLDVFVQAHPGKVRDLPAGQYRYRDGALERMSDELVLRKHVIAINQAVYERASIGITVMSRTADDWRSYIDLGRRLQQLEMNDADLGFMSSGYSSKSGNDLPSHRRMRDILAAQGEEAGPSYFCVGGRVSEEQLRSEGMKEDLVHMKGPAELVRDDLSTFLPDYMMPNRVLMLDRMPLTANGKVDFKALAERDVELTGRPYTAPRSDTEKRIAELWEKGLKRDAVSVQDDFFESGGNSLIAVSLINRINREFGCSLPLQVLFESPTVEKLARQVDDAGASASSRLVRLRRKGTRSPVFCWPGLGGYTMNLRLLAARADTGRPFYGVQAHGINENETPYATIKEMAAADIREIRRVQPEGPYTLWGYSFGARVAFETAYQLEQAGERVESLFLIAPGNPKVRTAGASDSSRVASYANRTYVTILFSVFAGAISGPLLEECLEAAHDDESFAAFVAENFEGLDPALVRRVTRIVHRTYSFEYAFHELAERRLDAPVTIFKAQGDDYSFIENSTGYSAAEPVVIDLDADHYSMLKDPGVEELVERITDRVRTVREQENYAAR
ncbi:amino acid adenylation protein [Streptomyces griseocarneus]|nr:amino acid adenylation protein [Streptomyces griseocarneus]